MPTRSSDKRWDSKFGLFVGAYGVELLAARLGCTGSAVLHWLHGVSSPRPSTALAICLLARRRHQVISLEDIYGHFEIEKQRAALAASR